MSYNNNSMRGNSAPARKRGKKKIRQEKQPKEKAQFGMRDWVYVVVVEGEVVARGHVLWSPSADLHFVQFGDDPANIFFRFMTNNQFTQGNLFPSAEKADAFVAAYQAQTELEARADVNGRTLEEQVQADAEEKAEAEATAAAE